MIEVLLQADRALASGALDQAERSYWQLVELDPTNAIAVTGLARVSLERGDARLARTFAERALAMDPDIGAAKRILNALAGGETPAPEEPDLPLLGAQRLEALGRRRASVTDDADSTAARPDRGRERKGPVEAPGGPFPQLPNEPLQERRQAGRQAAAAAAAAAEAAPRSQPPARTKTHQALGERARRRLNPGDIKPQPRSEDPFAAAESAAAIEAVGESDEYAGAEAEGRASEPDDQNPELDAVDAIDAVDAVDEGESIAMRVALVSGEAELDAAELDATPGELEATDEGESVTLRIALVSGAAEMNASELQAAVDEADLDAAEQEAAQYRTAPVDEVDLDEAARDAAEFQAAVDEADLDAAEQEAAQYRSPEFEGRPSEPEEAQLNSAEMDAAELEAAQAAVVARLGMTDDLVGDEDLDAAELDVEILAGRRTGFSRTHRIDLDAMEAELAAAELRTAALTRSQAAEPVADLDEAVATEPAAAESASAELSAAGGSGAEVAAAELSVAEPTAAQSASAEPAQPEAPTHSASAEPAEPEAPTQSASPDLAGSGASNRAFDEDEPTEEEAEAAAFREALDVVLGADAADSQQPAPSRSPAPQPAVPAASVASAATTEPAAPAGAAPEVPAGADREGSDTGEPSAPAKSDDDRQKEETQGRSKQRRKGLFGRFRGD
jgi:hypothetical protein